MTKDLKILKFLLEAEEDDKTNDQEVRPANTKKDIPDTAFDKDPMGFILRKYHTLNEVLKELMTPQFREYVTAIFIQSPKPTTFKVVLHNGQYFLLTYMMEEIYEANIAGKRYYLSKIGRAHV